MIRNWFRSKRSLVGQLDDFEVIVAKQIDEIAALRQQLDEGAIRASKQIADLRRGSEIGSEQVRRLTRERDDLSAQNIRVRNALQVLRDDLHRAENGGNLPSATGPGMARPAVRVTRPAPVRGSLAARVQARPLPADLADEIAQDAAAKRRADGEGDE